MNEIINSNKTGRRGSEDSQTLYKQHSLDMHNVYMFIDIYLNYIIRKMCNSRKKK